MVAAIAPTGTSVSVERNSPIADSPSSDTVTYSAMSRQRPSASPMLTESPESSATEPDGNSSEADERTRDAHHQGRRETECRRPHILHREQPDAAGRRDEQVAQRAVGCLARDRVTRHDADGERQEQGNADPERHEHHEQPVVLDAVEERRPRAATRPRVGHAHRDGNQDGHGRERSEHRPRPLATKQHAELGAEQGDTARGTNAHRASARGVSARGFSGRGFSGQR